MFISLAPGTPYYLPFSSLHKTIMTNPRVPDKRQEHTASDRSSASSHTIGRSDTPTSVRNTPTPPRTTTHSPPSSASSHTLGRSTLSPTASSHTVGCSATPSPSSPHTLGRSEAGSASPASSKTLGRDDPQETEKCEDDESVEESDEEDEGDVFAQSYREGSGKAG